MLFKYIEVCSKIFSKITLNLILLRVRLHVTELKSHPMMKKFLFTREFHPGMERVEFHSGMKFNLKEKLSLSMMNTYNKISHFSQLLKSEA